MTAKILIPDIGTSDGVSVIEVLVQKGDVINADQSLIVLESDKASMEVPADKAGVVAEVLVKVGDVVKEGNVIVEIAETAQQPSQAEKPKEEIPAQPAVEQKITKTEVAKELPEKSIGQSLQQNNLQDKTASFDENAFKTAYASPSVRRFARELGADLGKIKGTCRKGRISEQDVRDFVKKALSAPIAAVADSGIPSIPAVDFAQFGEIETQPLSRINVLTGEHMTRCWLNIPHVTQHDLTDITDLEQFRQSLKAEAEKRGVRVTMLSFLMKALVATLQQFPRFNSSLSSDGKSLILKKYFNIGVAVDTPAGLVVPVVREVDKKGIFELSADLAQISKKARDGKLTPKDLSGASMTISSLGGIGGTYFTPIVNAPEVAILGVSRSTIQPVWNGKEFTPKLMLPLSMSYDHRVIDGALAARMISYLGQLLTDFRRALL